MSGMNIYKALMEISRKSPEIFHTLEKTEVMRKKDFPSAGACIRSQGYEIVIREEWAETFDTHNIAAVMEHELMHIVFQHCDTMKDFEDRELANIAMDAIINDLAEMFKDKSKLNEHLKKGVFIDVLSKELNTRLSARTHTAKQIYDLMREEQKKNPSKQFTLCFDMGIIDKDDKGDSGSSPGMGVKGKDGADANTGELGELPKEIKDALTKMAGMGSLDAQILLERDRDRDLERKFKLEVSKFLCSNKREFEATKRRPNRRGIPLASGKKRVEKQKILIGMDMSGSMMDEKTLKRLGQVLDAGIKLDFEVDVTWGDTKRLGFEENIDKKFNFKKITGGGGTELSFIFDTKVKYDVIVCVTDGYFNHNEAPKKLKSKILFLLTEEGKVEGFKCVRI